MRHFVYGIYHLQSIFHKVMKHGRMSFLTNNLLSFFFSDFGYTTIHAAPAIFALEQTNFLKTDMLKNIVFLEKIMQIHLQIVKM